MKKQKEDKIRCRYIGTLNLYIFLLICISSINIAKAQKAVSMLKNNEFATDIINKAINKIQNEVKDTSNVDYRIDGNYYMSGHYFKPFDTQKLSVQDSYQFDRAQNLVIYKSQLLFQGKEYQKIEFSKLDTVFQMDYGDTKTRVLSGQEALIRISEYHLLFPKMGLKMALDKRTGLQFINSDSEAFQLSFLDYASRKINVWIGKRDFRVQSFQYLVYDPLMGDQVMEYKFTNYSLGNLPNKSSKTELLLDGRASYTTNNVSVGVDLVIDSVVYKLKPNFKLTSQVKKDIEVDTLDNNLFLFKLNFANNKVLVANYADYIVIFEAPLGSSKAVLDKIRQYFGKKVIKYVFVSHHHPDHAGGIREYAELGCTIITTPGYKNYYTQLIKSSHTLAGLPVKLTTPNFDFVTDFYKEYLDQNNKFIVYRVDSTEHSFEHLVVYLPSIKSLFVSDLVIFNKNGEDKGGKRARALLKAIEKNKIPVERIYTSWPLNGQRNYGTLDDLRKICKVL